MRFNSAVVKDLSNTVRAVAVAANFAEYHTDNFGFALFYLKIVYLIALAVLFACTYKLVTEGYGTAGIYPVQCKLVHTGFNSHRGFFALAGRLPKSDVVSKLIYMAVKALLALSGAPHLYSVLNKPLNHERRFVIYPAYSVKHKDQQNIKLLSERRLL